MTLRNAFGDMASDASMQDAGSTLVWLKRIFQALKPLGQITGSGSNRLSVDVNNVVGGNLGTVTTVTTCSTVTTVTTVGTVSNQTNMGGVAAFELMKAMSRQAYNGGVRSHLT